MQVAELRVHVERNPVDRLREGESLLRVERFPINSVQAGTAALVNSPLAPDLISIWSDFPVAYRQSSIITLQRFAPRTFT